MAPNYRKGSHQQYVVKSKLKAKVKSKVTQKLKATKVKRKGQSTVKISTPKIIPSATVPAGSGSAPEKMFAGYKAKMSYSNGGVKVNANIRYETEKTSPLVKIINVDKNMNPVTRAFEGPPKQEVFRRNSDGQIVPKTEVGQAQVMDDGSLKPVKIEKTKDIQVEPIDPRVANGFLPYSNIEVWGDGDSDVDGLREMAKDMITTGKIGAIKEFSHGYGKMYVGFVRPIFNEDHSKFGVEIMLAENKRSKRRWMLAEKNLNAPINKASAPVVPNLWGP